MGRRTRITILHSDNPDKPIGSMIVPGEVSIDDVKKIVKLQITLRVKDPVTGKTKTKTFTIKQSMIGTGELDKTLENILSQYNVEFRVEEIHEELNDVVKLSQIPTGE